jgi:hypothetical protein
VSGALALDHLVVAAASLVAGVAWCERTFGVTPVPGGRHPLMGTHNRLLSIASGRFARAYLEIIAVDPAAGDPGRARWFDLDDPALSQRIAGAPRLVHWVARCDDIEAALARLHAQGIDAGRVLEATRGSLRWRIAVRDDGARPLQGLLPTLIEWGDSHPTDAMAGSPVVLRALTLARPDPAPLQRALDALGWAGPPVEPAAVPSLQARLDTPRGGVALDALA